MMGKVAADHHVSTANESDYSGTPSSHTLHGPAQEILPLSTLPEQGTRPITSRDGSTSATSIERPSSRGTPLNIGRDQENDGASPGPNCHQPRWLRYTLSKSRTGMDRLQTTPGISKIWSWLHGPSPPRKYKITPLLPKLQLWPIKKLSRYNASFPGCSIATASLCIFWLITFSSILANSTKSKVSGGASYAPVALSCIGTLWDSSCGIDGRNCVPFKGSSFPFICPSGCASVEILEPQTVGDEQLNYRNFVIGGPSADNQSLSIYRGDSFICPAAIHAGVISDQFGGCAVLNREGNHSNFPAVERNGISSIGFEPSFPMTFSFSSSPENCRDPQWYVLAVSVFTTLAISMIATSPALFFSSTFVIVFFQVVLASDAPYSTEFAGVLSIAFERFLPAAFVAVVLYRYCVRYTMTGLKAYWDRSILWIGGCWVGALESYTFNHIPISRLTPHDIQQQPGAIVALIVIVLVILAAAIGQIWAFRREGRLVRFIGLYLTIGIIIGCLVAIPGLSLRLHHYILGLLLLPGTKLQTRPSLLYQGICIGLFINGTARWGFASILQTPATLLQGAIQGSDLPTGLEPTIVNDTISFVIKQITDGFDGISVLVNDVQRFQETNVSLPLTFNWTRNPDDEMTFFRFAFSGTYLLGGIWYGDYTKAGTWFGNGTWKAMLPGAS